MTIWVMSVVTPLTLPEAVNWNVAGVSMPAAPRVSVTDADVGLTESDSRPLIGGRRADAAAEAGAPAGAGRGARLDAGAPAGREGARDRGGGQDSEEGSS